MAGIIGSTPQNTASEATKQNKIERMFRSVPKIYKPGENPVITAFLKAFACSDAEVTTQIQNAEDQLFVRSAEGSNLDRLANSRGVSRPAELGLDDETFQELIPNLSFKPKQIRKAFYDTADVFWGPTSSRANLETNNSATFALVPGDNLTVQIDTRDPQIITVRTGEIANPGSATSDEAAQFLSQIDGATVTIVVDSLTGDEFINVRTNTPGLRGSVQFIEGSALASGKLEFSTIKRELRDQDQRVSVFEINPNEICMEIPAIVPALRRTLRGSHHFHADSTIEDPVAPANCSWIGSFFYDPNGVQTSFTFSSQGAKLGAPIFKGDILTSITVDDTSKFENSSGLLVFGLGTSKEEAVVAYRGIPNSNTILIDPSYSFQNDHALGTTVNVVTAETPYTPRRNGDDYAIYFTSPGGARSIVEDILDSLKAAGIVIKFIVLAPTYKYLCTNPYLDTDS